jgi:hypothetical protein
MQLQIGMKLEKSEVQSALVQNHPTNGSRFNLFPIRMETKGSILTYFPMFSAVLCCSLLFSAVLCCSLLFSASFTAAYVDSGQNSVVGGSIAGLEFEPNSGFVAPEKHADP